MKETKVYILDKLPNDCYECPNCNLIGNTCSISDNIYLDGVFATIGRHKDCPLIDIKDHDLKLVKEVCEDLTKSILNLKYVENTGEFATYVLSIIKSKQKEYEK